MTEKILLCKKVWSTGVFWWISSRGWMC